MLAVLALGTGLALGTPAVARAQDHDRNHDQQRMDYRMDDHDRSEAQAWYRAHERSLPPGLRERDRLSNEHERQLESGFTLDSHWRGYIHPVPHDLAARLRPAPHGYRYVFVGGHLVLMDSHDRVYDVIHMGHER